MSPLNITQPLGIWSINVYNGYYKVMSNIPKMGQLPTPVEEALQTYTVEIPWISQRKAWRIGKMDWEIPDFIQLLATGLTHMLKPSATFLWVHKNQHHGSHLGEFLSH